MAKKKADKSEYVHQGEKIKCPQVLYSELNLSKLCLLLFRRCIEPYNPVNGCMLAKSSPKLVTVLALCVKPYVT